MGERVLYLLCCTCRRAWLGTVAASCCNTYPLVVSPFTADRGVWFRARLGNGWRAAQVSAAANLTEREEMRRMLWRGCERNGRTVVCG